MLKVYLCGGLESHWKHVVEAAMDRFDNVKLLDPGAHGFVKPADFTRIDLEMIDDCDVMFCYFEDTNPGKYNSSFEMGYAFAKGKRCIAVFDTLHRFDMLVESAESPHVSLRAGLEELKQLASQS